MTHRNDSTPFHTIIWDWNGTLLNDTDICISSMNSMLKSRGMTELSHARYKDVFTFPVRDYYEAIGFDFSKESWDVAAHEFIEKYLIELPTCKLAEGTIEMLAYLRQKGYRQAIISAMQHEALLNSVKALEIEDYLEYIGGIGDHYGAGKIENALNFFDEFRLHPAQVTLIGDTLHDAEVAGELGCECILVASGHQSVERLLKSGHKVVQQLTDLKEYL